MLIIAPGLFLQKPTSSTRRIIFLMILALTSCIAGSSQEKYYFTIKGKLFTDSIIDQSCAGCYFTLKGNFGIDQSGGISFSPDSTLYVLSNVPEHNLYKINLSNPVPTLVFNGPGNLVHMGGLLAMGNGIFYSIPRSGEPSDSLYIWDINAGTVTAVGQLSYTPVGEMWLANGEMYYIGYSGNGTQTEIVRIDLSNPSNSESIVTIPGMYDIVGLTATPVSTLFRGADITSTTADMVTVNIIDGTITEICNVPKQAVGHAIRQITSLYEHQITGVEPFLDLDCDDSSLAT